MLSVAQLLENCQHFVAPKGSLSSSQEPYTGPCPEPDESNPYQTILSNIHLTEVQQNYSFAFNLLMNKIIIRYCLLQIFELC
jgi:hypothetical protein